MTLPSTKATLRWLWGLTATLAALVGATFLWWSLTAEARALHALPDEQRLALYFRTLANLKNICDPAAPRSLRDFCRGQAELALKFRECEADPSCLVVARRHIPQPRR